MPLPTSAGVLGMDAHDALRAQPLRDAVRADAGGHAQVQALPVWGRAWAAASLKVWGLTAQTTRPARASAGPACSCGSDAELGLELVARFGERLHHLDLGGRQALADQAADDGAGHVAAADEGDGLREGVVGAVCHGGKSIIGASLSPM